MLFAKYNSGFPASEVMSICLFAGLAGYFALRYDDDGEVCYAADESDSPTLSGVDVGERWRMAFEAIFYTSIG